MNFSELLGLFKEGKTTAHSHMKNLLEIALVDSHFDDSEKALLKSLAKKHGVSQKKLGEIRNNPDQVSFELPENENERFEQFYELIHMMAADDKILNDERNLCKIFSKKFGYKGGGDLVDAVAQNIEHGTSIQETQKRVFTLL